MRRRSGLNNKNTSQNAQLIESWVSSRQSLSSLEIASDQLDKHREDVRRGERDSSYGDCVDTRKESRDVSHSHK